MKINKKVEQHSSPIISELLNKITPAEKKRISIKMQLAAKIDDLISQRGFTKSGFAGKLGKNPSEISKWLSGTHNFTLDTLVEISDAFDISILDLFLSPPIRTVNKIHFVVISEKRPQDIVYDTPNISSFSNTPVKAKKGKYSVLTPF